MPRARYADDDTTLTTTLLRPLLPLCTRAATAATAEAKDALQPLPCAPATQVARHGARIVAAAAATTTRHYLPLCKTSATTTTTTTTLPRQQPHARLASTRTMRDDATASTCTTTSLVPSPPAPTTTSTTSTTRHVARVTAAFRVRGSGSVALEEELYWLLHADTSWLHERTRAVLCRVLDALRSARHDCKAGRPPHKPVTTTTPATAAVVCRRCSSSSSSSSHRGCVAAPCSGDETNARNDDDDAHDACVVHALTSACRCADTAQACAALQACYDAHDDGATPSRCLVAAALASVRLQRHAQQHQRPSAHDDDSDDDGDVAHTLQLLDEAVAAGHVGAMCHVARCLRDGVGVTADLATALVWLEHAACAAGYCPAQHELALWYECGVRVGECALDADWGSAASLYGRAAAADYVPAQLNMGKLLLSAARADAAATTLSFLERDALTRRARDWLETAAAHGCEEAARLCRSMWRSGSSSNSTT